MFKRARLIVYCIPAALFLALLTGCCGIIAGEVQSRPTLPPVQGPSIVTATPRTSQPGLAAATATAPSELPAAGTSKMVVSANGDGVYVRSKPEMQAKVRAWPDGTVVDVFSCDGDWCQVQTPNGYKGYMPRRYLAPAPGSAPLATNTPAATAAPAQTAVTGP